MTTRGSETTPLYEQVQDRLRQAIINDVYPAGTSLPSEKLLEEEFGVSRITVRRALDELVREGLIERGRGRAARVVGPLRHAVSLLSEEALSSNLNLAGTQTKILSFEWQLANQQTAHLLEREEGEPVLRLTFVRYRKHRPIFYAVVVLPQPIGMLIDRKDLEHRRIREVLVASGVPLVSSEQTLSAAPCPDGLAQLLELEPGAPIFAAERVLRDNNAKPVQYLQASFRWDRFKYRVAIRHRAAQAGKDNPSLTIGRVGPKSR